MAKPEQVLEIDPQHELKFKGPFDQMVTSFLKVHNPTDHKVLFKIKTTAPKKYCVRPNSGHLEPKERTVIHVCLQPFDYDPNEKNKHKFMVQSIIVPSNSENTVAANPDAFWKDAKPEDMMDTKLKCVFEYPCQDGHELLHPVSSSSPITTSTDEVRIIGDSVRTTNAADGELVKAKKDVKHLMEEESQLRQENIKMKEELLMMQKMLDSSRAAAAARESQVQPIYQTPLIIIAVVTGLLGIILGKFLL